MSDDPEIAELAASLRALRVATDESLRKNYARSLPFADGLFDRWERAKRLGFGAEASIYDSALVFGAVEVGRASWIGPNVMLDGSGGGLKIGAYCSISAGTYIYTHDTVLWAVSGGALPRREGPVSIADRVYIGSQTLVLPGVTIGSRVVVAGNSLVNRDVPEGWIVAGTPARQIGVVNGEGAQARLAYFERKSELTP